MSEEMEIKQKRIQGVMWSISRSGNALRADIYTHKCARWYRITDMTELLEGNIRIGDELIKKRVDEKYRFVAIRTEDSSKEKITVPDRCPKCRGKLMKIIRPRFEKLRDQGPLETVYLCNNYTECIDAQLAMWGRMECKLGFNLPKTNINLKRKLLTEMHFKTPFDLYKLIGSRGHITWKTLNQYTQKEKDSLKALVARLPRSVSMTQLLFVGGYPVSFSKTRKLTEYCHSLADIKRLTRETIEHVAKIEKIKFSSSEIDACLKFVKLPIFLTLTRHTPYIVVVSSAQMKQLIRLTKRTKVLLHGTARNTKNYGHYHRYLINHGCVLVKEVSDAKLILADDIITVSRLRDQHPKKIVLNIHHMEALRETPYFLY